MTPLSLASLAQPRQALLPEDIFTLSVPPLPKISSTVSHLGLQGRVLHHGPHVTPPCSSSRQGPPRSSSSSGSWAWPEFPHCPGHVSRGTSSRGLLFSGTQVLPKQGLCGLLAHVGNAEHSYHGFGLLFHP